LLAFLTYYSVEKLAKNCLMHCVFTVIGVDKLSLELRVLAELEQERILILEKEENNRRCLLDGWSYECP